MAQVYDEMGNPWRGAVDYVNGEAFNETRTTENLLAVVNAEIVTPCNGAATLAVQITGTFVGTLVVEGHTQTGQYITLPVCNATTGQYVVNGITGIGFFYVPVTGLAKARVRMSAYTSGSANVSMRTSLANALIQTETLPSALGITVTGAAGAAATLTIPSGGAGMFHYIDYVEITHFGAAAGVAAATPVLVTTTNIPGTPTVSCRADAFAQGSTAQYRIGGAVPIKSTTAATATTVLMPATTSVIWRAIAFYRLGV